MHNFLKVVFFLVQTALLHAEWQSKQCVRLMHLSDKSPDFRLFAHTASGLVEVKLTIVLSCQYSGGAKPASEVIFSLLRLVHSYSSQFNDVAGR